MTLVDEHIELMYFLMVPNHKQAMIDVLNGIVRFGRVDVLRWLFMRKTRGVLDMHWLLRELPDDWPRGAVKDHGVNAEAFLALVLEREAFQAQQGKIIDMIEQFREVVRAGAAVATLRSLCDQHAALVAAVAPEWRVKLGGLQTLVDKDVDYCYSPLRDAVTEGHAHVVEWLFTEREMNGDCALRTLALACERGRLQVVQWLVRWMMQQGIDMNVPLRKRSEGEEERRKEGLLDICLSYLVYDRKHRDSRWNLLQWVVSSGAVSVRDACEGAILLELANKTTTDPELASDIPESLSLEILQFLVSFGADVEAHRGGESVVSVFACAGCVEIVRWLVEHKGVCIQHLILDHRHLWLCHSFEREAEVKREIEALQLQQRQREQRKGKGRQLQQRQRGQGKGKSRGKGARS